MFEDEVERIWGLTWVFVGHESEVAWPGVFVTRRIGRVPVILTRDRDGELRLLVNRCAHRGNTVCQEERGTATVFKCAYHGWSFDNRGDLLGATFPDGYGPDFDKRDWGLDRLPRVGSYGGFVFGSLAATGETLEEHLGPARPYLDQFTNYSPEGRISFTAGAIKSRLRGNWKFPMENAVDGYHPAFLHKSVMVDRSNRDAKVAEQTTRSRAISGTATARSTSVRRTG